MRIGKIRPAALALAFFVISLAPPAEAATDREYVNKTATGGGTAYPNIDHDWDGGDIDISVDNVAGASSWIAKGIGLGKVGELTITSTTLGDASLTIGSAMVITDSDPKRDLGTLLVSDISLTGHSATSGSSTYTGWAHLSVKDGKTVSVSGTLNMNASSKLTVEGSGSDYSYFLTNNFDQSGANSQVEIKNQGVFLAVKASSITDGTFRVDAGGTAYFRDTLTLGGDATGKPILELAGGNLVLSEGPVPTGGSAGDYKGVNLNIAAGGTLLVTGDSKILDDERQQSKVNNNGGHLIVQSGASLEAETITVSSGYTSTGHTHGTEIGGSLKAVNFESKTGGTTLVTGTLETTTQFTMSGGTLDIDAGGTVTNKIMTVTGGIVNVRGELTGSSGELSHEGGTINVASGGAVRLASVNVKGENAVFNVSGTVDGETPGELSFSVTNGNANFSSGSSIAGGRGGDGLESLAVSGLGTLSLSTGVLTKSLALSGTLNLNAGGALEVEHNSTADAYQVVSGDIHLRGGELYVHNDLKFRAGTVYGTAAGGFIDLSPGGGTGNHRLFIESLATFDASEGDILVQNAGGLTLDGTYIAGHNGTGATMLKVSGTPATGTFTVGSNAQVYLSRALQQVVNSGGLTGGDGYRILDTDADSVGGAMVPFEIFDETTLMYYTYEYKRDPTTGWGLHVTGARELTREDQKNLIKDAWRPQPNLDNYLENVMRDDFLDAIVDGNRIAIGVIGDYDGLSQSGKFNADVLSSLTTPATSGYDSLMLYNGSGLGMANRAIVNSNQQTLKRLSLRNNFIRREITLNGDACNPCMDPYWEEPEPGPANRFWATGVYSSDSSGTDEGFRGYEYRGKGMLLGYDRLIGRLAVGGAFAYTGGDFKDSAAITSDSTIDTYGGFIYGNYQSERGLFVSGTVGYAFSDNLIRDYRVLDGHGGWNSADYRSHSLLASISMGIDIPLGDCLILTPSTGFTYAGTRSDSHNQFFSADDGSVNANTISAGRIKDHSSTIPVDLALSYELYGTDESLFVLTGTVGYAYELNNKGASGTISYEGLTGVGPVGIASRRPGRHIYSAGLNAKYMYKQYEIGFGYDFVGRTKYDSHSFTASAGIVF